MLVNCCHLGSRNYDVNTMCKHDVILMFGSRSDLLEKKGRLKFRANTTSNSNLNFDSQMNLF